MTFPSNIIYTIQIAWMKLQASRSLLLMNSYRVASTEELLEETKPTVKANSDEIGNIIPG